MVNKRMIPRSVLLTIALLLALAMLILGVQGGVASSLSTTNAATTPTPTAPVAPGYTVAPCPFKLPAGQVDGKTVKCGYLAVPQDRQDPKSPLIRLAVATFRNPGTKTEKDPVIYLPAPGENELELLSMTLADFTAPVFAAKRDLIVFDQRGAGLAEPALDCPTVVDLNHDLLDMSVKGKKVGDKEALDLQLQAIAACAKTLGAKTDLSDFHTNASAADVEDLRRALGYDKVNLWGVLDGTRLALEVLRDYPAGVRSVVLDSVIPPEVDTVKESPANLARSLDVLFKACAADKTCNTAYPKLQQTFKDVVANLNKTPLSMKTSDPVTGKTYDARLDGNTMVGLLHASLSVTDLLPVLPMLIDRAGKGDATLANAVLGAVVATQSFVSDGDIYSILCHDEVAFASPVDVNAAAKKYPELAGYFEYSLTGKPAFRLCDAWGAGKANPADNKPVLSDVPALVLRGSFDPNTAPAWAQATVKNLKKATLVEIPGLSSSVSAKPCPAELMAAFLKYPSKAPDTACIKKTQQPQWKLPLAPYYQPQMGIQGVVPAGWEEGDMGVFVRSDLEIDPTSLQLQAMPMTVEDFTNLFAESQEMPDELRSSGTYQSKNVVWTLYTIEKPDRYGDIAIGESDGLTLFILMRSVPAEREVLIQAVFVPAMDALVAITGPEVDATNQFLETLKKKDYTATTALVTDELLSAAGGVKGVETWLKQHKIEPKTWVLNVRDVAPDSALFEAILTLSDGSQTRLRIELLPVGGKWLVNRLIRPS